MKQATTFLLLAVAALGVVAWQAPAAHAQGKTYPGYYWTPSPSYYPMRNWYDQDTYMNPNPFPSYQPRMYDDPAATSNSGYRIAPPRPAPEGFRRFYAADPTLGYYYEGPFVYSHYDRAGRMAFRYGWW
jgi:hypothetical protein